MLGNELVWMLEMEISHMLVQNLDSKKETMLARKKDEDWARKWG